MGRYDSKGCVLNIFIHIEIVHKPVLGNTGFIQVKVCMCVTVTHVPVISLLLFGCSAMFGPVVALLVYIELNNR